MPTSRIEIIVDGKDNASGALRSIGGSMDQLGGHAGKMGGALGRMGEIAGGILGAQAIMGVGRALGGAVKEAFEATASYEKLGMALENLAKKDFIRAGTATKLIQVGTQEVSTTKDNSQAIGALAAKRDLLMAKMNEQAERHRQLIAKWGEEGLAVKTHAAQMVLDQQAIDKVNAKMAELGDAGTKVVGVYKKVTEQFISDAEAKEMAAKTSKELLGWIEQLAIKSPFTQDGIQSAFKTAMAYGFITDQAADLMVKTGQLDEKQRANTVTAQRLTQAMIDYAAGAGLSPEIMDRVSLALGQIQARGKLAGQEVMQLTEAGISVDAILAQAFGKSTSEIVAMREKGLIPANDAILAITQSLEKDFGGAAAAQTTTFAGLVSSLSDIKTIGLREFFTGTFEALQPYLAGFVDWASTLGPKLSELGGKIGTYVAGAAQLITGIVQIFQTEGLGGLLAALGTWWDTTGSQWVTTTVGKIGTWIGTIPGKLLTLANTAADWLAGMWNSIHAWWDTNGSDWVTATVGKIGGAVGAIPGAIVTLALSAVDWLKDVWNSIHTWWDTTGATWATTTAGKVGAWIKDIPSKIGALGISAVDWLTSVWNSIHAWWDTDGQTWAQTTADKINAWIPKIKTAWFKYSPQWVKDAATWLSPMWMGMVDWWTDHVEPLTTEMAAAFQNWVTDELTPALQNQDKSTWAAGIGKVLADGISEGIQYLYTPDVANQMAFAIAHFFAYAFFESMSTFAKLVYALPALLIEKIFGGNQKADISPAIKFFEEALKGVFEGFREGFLESELGQFAKKVFEKFIAAVKDVLGIKSPSTVFFKIGQEVLNGLVDGIGEGIDKAKTAIEDVAKGIVAKIKEFFGIESPSTLMAGIGLNLVEGLKQGMDEAVDAFKTWVVDWARSIIPEPLWKFFGIASPSLLMMQIGQQLVAGLIAGIKDMTPEAVQAISTSLGAMLDSVVKAIEAFVRLADMPTINDLAARLNRLTGYIRTLVAAFAVLAGYYAGPDTGLAGAKAVLDPLSEIFSKLQEVIEGIAALGALEMPVDLVAKVGTFVANLRSILPILITALVQIAAQFKPAAQLAAAAFAETAGLVVAPLTAMVDAFTSVATWVPAHLQPAFAGLLSQLRRLAALWIVAANGFNAGILEGALWFAGVANTLVAPLTAMVDGFASVAAWVPAHLEPAFAGLLSQLRRLAALWNTAVSGFDAEMLEGALWFASIAGALVAPLQAMVQGFAAVATWVPAGLGTAFAGMLSQLRRLAALWKTAVSGFDAEMLEGALWFASIAGALVAPLKAMVDGFAAVATWVPQWLEPLFAGMLSQLRRLAKLWKTAVSGFDAEILEGALWFAGVANTLVAPLKAMVDGFAAVATWVPQNIEPIFAGLLSQLRRLANLWIVAARGFDDDLLDGAIAFADRIQKLVGFVQPALAAIKALAEYTAAENLTAAVGAFVADIVVVAVALKDGLAGRPVFGTLQSAYDGAIAFAERIQKLVGVITPGITAIKALAGYIAAENLVRAVGAFVDDILVVAAALKDGLAGRPVFGTLQSTYDGAIAFAERIQKIIGVVQPGITAIKALAGYTAAQNLTTAVGAFVADIVLVAIALKDGLTSPARLLLAAYDAAIVFAERIQKIIGFVTPGITAIKALAGYVAAAGITAAVSAFVADILLVAIALKDGLTSPARLLLAAYDGAIAFAERIQKIVGFVQPGITTIKALAEYTAAENLTAAVGAFVADILVVAAALKDGLGSLTEPLQAAYDGAIVFAERIQKVIGVVQPGITAIKALAGYTAAHNITGAVRAFVADVLIVARGLKDGLGSLSEPLLAAYDAAIQFAQRIQGLVALVQPGLTAIAALASYVAAQNIAAKVRLFVADIIVVAIELKNGLSNATPEMLAALDAARQFTDRVQAIFNFIRPAIDAMRDLRDYARPYGVGTGIVTLLRDLETLITWLNTFAGSIGANTITAAAAFAETLERIVASIEAALAGLARLVSAYSSGELVGGSWMDGIIDGLTSRLPDLQELMRYIRGLFPSSPAKYGPFRSLPDGKTFGSTWGDGLLAGLGSTLRPMTKMLEDLRSPMILQPAAFGGGSYVNAPTNITLAGTFNVRQDQDIQSIAEAVGGILSQQASINRRMNLGWSAL